MQENTWLYILQIITILVTLGLGIYNSIENKKSEHSHNIISVTTKYRMKRNEQLKECCQKIITNSVPALLKENQNQAYHRLQELYSASAQITSILHRCFDADLELIKVSEKICKLSGEFIKAFYEDKEIEKTERKLIGLTKFFTIKCDMYTYAEWIRIKKETSGKETQSAEWDEIYSELKVKFNTELNQVVYEYDLSNEIDSLEKFNTNW